MAANEMNGLDNGMADEISWSNRRRRTYYDENGAFFGLNNGGNEMNHDEMTQGTKLFGVTFDDSGLLLLFVGVFLAMVLSLILYKKCIKNRRDNQYKTINDPESQPTRQSQTLS